MRVGRPLSLRQGVTAGLLIAFVLSAASYAQHGSPARTAALLTVAVVATAIAATMVAAAQRRRR